MLQATTQPKRRCPNCEAPFAPKTARAKFCSIDCNVKWQNRINMRGATLYTLWMTNRHERGLAKTLKVLHVMTRLAMYWHSQDRGRKTWNDARKVVEKHAWAEATVVFRPKR